MPRDFNINRRRRDNPKKDFFEELESLESLSNKKEKFNSTSNESIEGLVSREKKESSEGLESRVYQEYQATSNPQESQENSEASESREKQVIQVTKENSEQLRNISENPKRKSKAKDYVTIGYQMSLKHRARLKLYRNERRMAGDTEYSYRDAIEEALDLLFDKPILRK
ncbi:hypothetical protein [Fulvivirga lutea]|uniref:Uncharacterized protein n=1 Tax=Fulvivirga lutea TaxID=2810512 RepID=A0A975A277_9BACT|nr:hypothetical protein [Fulvivirga lutea]QSE99189.1 hypothetical protein JR347_08900 [Fulvivirga lutea]